MNEPTPFQLAVLAAILHQTYVIGWNAPIKPCVTKEDFLPDAFKLWREAQDYLESKQP